MIAQIRGARIALTKEIATRFPGYAQMIDPKPLSVNEVRAVMRPDEAFIATFVGEKRTFVWAFRKSGDVAFAAVDLGRESVAETVAEIRTSWRA